MNMEKVKDIFLFYRAVSYHYEVQMDGVVHSCYIGRIHFCSSGQQ